MGRSTNWALVRVLLVVLLLAYCQAADCSTATSSQCGTGTCQGYVMINNVCTSSCGSSSYYQNSTGMCVSCSSLSQSTCSVNCPNFYYTSASSSNSTNSTNSTGSSNSTNSTSSNSTNSTNNTVPGGSSTCRACSIPYGISCIACNSSVCTQCAIGLQLTSNSQGCIDIKCNINNCVQCSGSSTCYLCQPGYQINPSGKACTPVNCSVSYCSRCSGASCVTCISGYSLSNNTCQPICDSRCITCVSPGVCSKCISGYILDSKSYSCIIDCSVAFNGLCVNCINLLYCTTCKQGYKPALGGAICQVSYSCTVSQCSTCSIASICTACNTGYTLTNNNNCVKDICFIQGCATCASAKTCQTCTSLYTLSSSKTSCVPVCSTNIPQCLSCNTTTSCQACNVGYMLSSNQCVTLCSISNCDLCLSGTTCLRCAAGYDLNDDQTTCSLICSDPYCLSCTTASTCTTCYTGFSKGSNGRCAPNCRQGSAMNNNGVCQQCKISLSNCQACSFDTSNNIACTQCTSGYYLNAGNCLACSDALTNCRQCSSPSVCTQCTQGYVVSSGVCVSRANCGAKNCLICQSGSQSKCATCENGFAPDSNSNCKISCTSGQILIKGVCTCPLGTYLQSSQSASCVNCADSNCLVCSIASCSSCIQGYYPLGNACQPCMANCAACFDGNTCAACQFPYVFNNGVCTSLGNGFCGGVSSSGAIFTCDPGCSTCGMTNDGTMVCLTTLDGYSQVGDNIIKCHPTCRSCNGATATDCLSCFNGAALSGGSCSACSDKNALTCSSSDASFSLTCVKGYTVTMNLTVSPSTSTCSLCAGNCYTCDINGAGTCDPGQCEVGYVQQPGNTNCTQCFGGCSACDPSNLMSCIDCGVSRYTDESGQCVGCPVGCKQCTSSTVCTSCILNFVMVGTLCQSPPVWPCVTASNGACTKCVQNFDVISGSCVYNNTCSQNATCTNCPYGYYLTNVSSSLQGICSTCPPISNCLSCDPQNTTSCLLCGSGFYASSGVCSNCGSGCSKCTSSSFCSQAADGYYLIIDRDGTNSGQTGACSFPCLTCSGNPNFCLSCVIGYNINGSTCFSNKFTLLTMTFNYNTIFNSTDSFDVAFGKILIFIGMLRSSICNNFPRKIRNVDPTCKSTLNFLKFAHGSVVSTSKVDSSAYDNANDAANDLLGANLLPGATDLSTTVSTNGFTSSSNSSTNLGLILGVSIPLGILRI